MKKYTDEDIIQALLATGTKRKAAELIGMSERQLYERLKGESLQEKYKEARQELLRGATVTLQNKLNDATGVLVEVMNDNKTAAQTRVNAATNVIQLCLKMTEQHDIVERLNTLEDMQNS